MLVIQRRYKFFWEIQDRKDGVKRIIFTGCNDEDDGKDA
jgi:hypothetical protein